MSLSLNEVEATAKRAARGAGYPWGLAEEAAKATRWLCAHDFDGCAALAGLLQKVDGTDVANWSPVPGGGVWNAADGALCPLATGTAISDRAHEGAANCIRLGGIAHPILLAPFAALLAQQVGQTVTLELPGAKLSTDGDEIGLNGTISEASPWASVGFGGTVGRPKQRCHRAQPDPCAWTTLATYAHRTYAPATEESRLKGAGAGLTDND
ncbi:MAG: DUF3726 domain-containing protein [Rhodobacter sp.]|nr:DUF3726 domain-containing protein [Rhodobacter sp.]